MRDADVVVSNFRAGVMERIGFGYEALSGDQPAASSGPRAPASATAARTATRAARTSIAQAYSGVMWRRESDEIPLSVYPTTLCDYTTGMHLMQGILLALLARERTGEGQKVDVTMYDSMLHMQMQEACMQLNRGYEVNWAAMPLSGVFPTTDGAVCMVGAFKENPLRDISEALELARTCRCGRSSPPARSRRRTGTTCGRSSWPGSPQNTTEHWVQAAGVGRHPVRPRAHAGRGAAGRADAGQPHDRGDGAPDRRHRPGAGRADPPVGDAGRPCGACRRGSASTTPRCSREHGFTDDEVATLTGAGVLR